MRKADLLEIRDYIAYTLLVPDVVLDYIRANRGEIEKLSNMAVSIVLVDKPANRLVQNTESKGRFHTDWLNMIYPRLILAKDLLAINGLIFISIDDNEQNNLRKVCDEVLGTGDFVNAFI